jgi:hypothetical protein
MLYYVVHIIILQICRIANCSFWHFALLWRWRNKRIKVSFCIFIPLFLVLVPKSSLDKARSLPITFSCSRHRPQTAQSPAGEYFIGQLPALSGFGPHLQNSWIWETKNFQCGRFTWKRHRYTLITRAGVNSCDFVNFRGGLFALLPRKNDI